tara:strand:- start:23172 stop:23894 length:723 start_codon:yes stop_codon:yes gene_type:complete
MLIIIPARSGSKRVKNKNMKLLNGIPLLGHKIRSCLKTGLGEVIVSTDSLSISKFAKKMGAKVPFIRSKKYSASTSTMMSCVLYTLKKLKDMDFKLPKYTAVLPPTAPFLKTESISKIYNKIRLNKIYNSICTYTVSSEHPFLYINPKRRIEYNILEFKGNKLTDFERSQDWPKSFIHCNAMQVSKTSYYEKFLKKFSPRIKNFDYDINSCLGYQIDKIEAFDINTNFDFRLAKLITKIK